MIAQENAVKAPIFHSIETIDLACGQSQFQGSIDSGAEISVIRRAVVPGYRPTGTNLKLTGAFGEQAIAELAYVPLRLIGKPRYIGREESDKGILCAVTDKLASGVDALITPGTYEQLLEETAVVHERPVVEKAQPEAKENGEPIVTAEVEAVCIDDGAKQTDPLECDADVGERERFRLSQVADPSLKEAWEQARARTHGMIVIDGLLYHKDNVAGMPCNKLVLAQPKQADVLRLAHDSGWAGHLGKKKTLQRIKTAFFWPAVSGDVKQYCQSCHQCQNKARVRTRDRVPIAPITRQVLQTIAQVGPTANAEKCKFAQQEVKYLGLILGLGKHAPDPERVLAVQNICRPQDKRELRSFFGLCNYYHDYVLGYATLVLPLTDLTGRRVPQQIPWSDAAQKAFEGIKEQLTSAPTLHAPDVSKGYILATDASDVALGACLAQIDEKCREMPVALLSKKLTSVETRSATIEREAYAVVWASQRLETWLFGASVTVVTDRNPLKFLTLTSPQSARPMRWALALQKFNVTVMHKKGKLNANADALSRLASPHSLG